MSSEHDAMASRWIGLRRLPMESDLRAVLITLIVCLVSSAAIALTVSLLRPYQEANRASDRRSKIQQMVGAVPGLEEILDGRGDAQVEAKIVDLETGGYREIDPEGFVSVS